MKGDLMHTKKLLFCAGMACPTEQSHHDQNTMG
jgi:hypothetical protein